ncbi:MAG TPA: hypothetical protein PLN45_06485 [Exilispira sp.]|nr:hypothetical protein [Exilispira sp.]HQM89476.1 hypothetical protein [Exilispira sp.]
MERRILRDGGMRKKYETLINLILQQDKEARVVNEKPSDISIVLTTMSGRVIINILATFRSVTVTWLLDSYLLGNHKLMWEFDKDEDQEYMFERMNKEINVYMENKDFENRLQDGIDKVTRKYLEDQ